MKCPAVFKIGSNSIISTYLGKLEMSNYDHKNKQLLNFHIITPQVLNCKVPSRFRDSYNVGYFKVIKHLKSLQKAEVYLEVQQTFMIVHFCEYI